MSIYIDGADALHHTPARPFSLACPHCTLYSRASVLAAPRFAELQRQRPQHIGIVFRCHSCDAPIFASYSVAGYEADRVELVPQYSQPAAALERFGFDYLPDEAEILFREALGDYAAHLYNAFASLCRRTAQAVFRDVGENGRLQMFGDLGEIRRIADLDQEMFQLIKKILFDTDADIYGLPLLPPEDAAIVLEVVRDLLHQAYVRRGRLQDAMVARREIALAEVTK